MNFSFSLLILEDDPDEKQLFSLLLKRHFPEWAWHFVETADELMGFLSKEASVSLLLLDINLPGKDGLQILKELRQIDSYRSLPIIGFSNKAEREVVFDVILNGAVAFFKKPIEQEEIVQLFRTFPAYAAGR